MKNFRTCGFTLIEIIVVISIVAGISIVLSQVFFTTTRTTTKNEITKEVKQTGDYALQVIERTIRNASTVISECSAVGTTRDAVNLENIDGSSTKFRCITDSGVNRIALVHSVTGTTFITSEAVTLGGTDCASSSISFTCYTLDSIPGFVKVNYSLTQATSNPNSFEAASESFQTTVTIRNKN